MSSEGGDDDQEQRTVDPSERRLAQAFGPALRARAADGPTGACAWVNLLSIFALANFPAHGTFSASKAAVIGLTKSIGKELAKTGIRVNCITPAAVKTAIFDQMTPQHIEFMLSKIPMARFGQIEEIAAMVAWLASEECSFSTGAVFDLSGGRAVY